MSAATERLRRRTRVFFSAGSISGNAISQAWTLWLIYFYAPPSDATIATRVPDVAGIDARVVLGIVLTSARLLEAIDDPLIGYWSDRMRSPWGRRIPFIVLGTPWWALLFVLLFFPPTDSPDAVNLAFLFVLLIGFYLLSNLSGAPYEALLPSIARRADDRISIATWQVLFGVGGAVIGLSLSSLLQAFFGFQVMAVTIAAIALAVRYIALAGCWREARADAAPAVVPLRRALRDTFTNREFLAYLPSFVCFQVGLQMLTALLPFFVEAVLHESTFLGWTGRGNAGIFSFLLTAAVIVGMLAGVPVFARLGRARGKAAAYRVAMLGSAAYFPLLFFAGFIPLLPTLGQAFAMIFLAGLPTAGVFLFPNIITADIVDEDAGRTGTRREAMYYGSQNQVEKAATALSPLLFAIVLLAGDSAANPLGVRLVGPAAGLLVLVGWLFFRGYTLAPDAPPPAAEARRAA